MVLGGGFAGASLAIALQKLSRVDLILIDAKVCVRMLAFQIPSILASSGFTNPEICSIVRTDSSTRPPYFNFFRPPSA